MTMEGDQLNSGAASLMGAVDAAPEDGSSTGWSPAVMSSIATRPELEVTTPRREAEVRHHERQLCSMEMLILAGRAGDEDVAGVLIEAAVAISRRQVA